MQSFPLAIAEAVKPETVGAQSLFERARAGEALITEIADSVETAMTKAKKWWSARRTTRLKVPRLTANPIESSSFGSRIGTNNKKGI